jgi:hypothetical protein
MKGATTPPVLHWTKLFEGYVWAGGQYSPGGGGIGYGFGYGYGYGFGYGNGYGNGYGDGYDSVDGDSWP